MVKLKGSKKKGWLIEIFGNLNSDLFYKDIMPVTHDELVRLHKLMTRKLSTSKLNERR